MPHFASIASPLPSSWTIKLFKQKDGPVERQLHGYRDFNITQFEVSFNKESWLAEGFTHYEVAPVFVPGDIGKRFATRYVRYKQPDGEEGRY